MRRLPLRLFVSLAVPCLMLTLATLGDRTTLLAAPPQQEEATATATPTATPSAATDFAWTRVPSSAIGVTAGSAVTISNLQLTNQRSSTITDTGIFEISVTGLPSGASFDISPGQTIPIVNGQGREVLLSVAIPAGTTPGAIVLRVIAVKTGIIPAGANPPTPVPVPRTQAVAFVTLNIVAGATTTPTGTPAICPEREDPGGSLKSAALLRVDREERHGICRTGDEDWYKFAGVGGKRYTIDVPQMDPGLDLALQLFNDQGALLDTNDDFPLRSSPAISVTDTRPQIFSFLAPRDALYFVRVYDTLGIGGDNLTYRIIVRSEGYAEPPIVPSVCNDLYEPDGLPEQAKTLLANDTHRTHRLCPAGDADWVKFFASNELVYFLLTDTQSMNGNNPQPGADTIMYLFSRDGVTLIASNNNAPGGNTLDSAIEFRPPADGIYYAQIKNVGDVGNNFITYNLTLKGCVSAEQASCVPPVAVAPTSNPTTAPTSAVPTIEVEFEDE